ncbi:MAG: polysaccharide deacetylase family protein [Janthinobacterium lividum]
MSKREKLARTMEMFGMTRFMEALPSRPGILVINHHRIGLASDSRFDRGVFSATQEQLGNQVQSIKRRYPIVYGEELQQLLSQTKPLKRLHVAFTFDDGYLDNYQQAFPVFKAHSAGALFFLVPEYVGTATIPWWDAIASYVRNTRAQSITLSKPEPLTISLNDSRENAIRQVLQHYKRKDNTDPAGFVADIERATSCPLPEPGRRFLDWEEASEMQKSGMEVGSHTFSHRILSQLSIEEQESELFRSKQQIEQHLHQPVTSLAYPVGQLTSFTKETERLARATGYGACFSFYGGVNQPGRLNRTNLLRTSADPDPVMFRNEIALVASLGRSLYA